MPEKKISFLASMPPIQSALRFSGDGNGARLQLDIPENQMVDAAWLLSMRQSVLKVTIEIYEQSNEQQRDDRKSTY